MTAISKTEYQILSILDKYSEPVGSGTISSAMTECDISVSEATVGRVLRELDRREFTRKMGYRGRILTDYGKEILIRYHNEKKKEKQMEKFLRISKIKDKDELIDILIARRAIEREIARLAAVNVSGEDLKELEKIIILNEKHIAMGLSGAEEDVKFHKYIAGMGNNKVLNTVLDMIRSDRHLSPVFEYIRREVGSSIVDDHKDILNALKTGSPELAEKAVMKHINNIINDVDRYWQRATG